MKEQKNLLTACYNQKKNGSSRQRYYIKRSPKCNRLKAESDQEILQDVQHLWEVLLSGWINVMCVKLQCLCVRCSSNTWFTCIIWSSLMLNINQKDENTKDINWNQAKSISCVLSQIFSVIFFFYPLCSVKKHIVLDIKCNITHLCWNPSKVELLLRGDWQLKGKSHLILKLTTWYFGSNVSSV